MFTYNPTLVAYVRDNANTLLEDYLTPGEKEEFVMHNMDDIEIANLAEELLETSEEFEEYAKESFQECEEAYATKTQYRYN